VVSMPRVLNFKINDEGIVLDDIMYDEHGEFDDRDDLIPLGWYMWGDDPEDIVTWLEKHLSTNSHLYDRVDIDVEGLKGQ
jgi:hypothetical protein